MLGVCWREECSGVWIVLCPGYSSAGISATGHDYKLAQLRAALRLLKIALGLNNPQMAPGVGTAIVTIFHSSSQNTLGKGEKCSK